MRTRVKNSKYQNHQKKIKIVYKYCVGTALIVCMRSMLVGVAKCLGEHLGVRVGGYTKRAIKFFDHSYFHQVLFSAWRDEISSAQKNPKNRHRIPYKNRPNSYVLFEVRGESVGVCLSVSECDDVWV